jgi:hypothetical protein
MIVDVITGALPAIAFEVFIRPFVVPLEGSAE